VSAVAAEIAVPFPFKRPVMLVVKVIAGVVVAFATVPVNPFVETTETVVTVPVPLAVFVIVVVPETVATEIPVPAAITCAAVVSPLIEVIPLMTAFVSTRCVTGSTATVIGVEKSTLDTPMSVATLFTSLIACAIYFYVLFVSMFPELSA